MLAAGKCQKTYCLSNEEKETWIEDYVERETAVPTKRVGDAETAIKQEQDDMRHAEMAGLRTTKPETIFDGKLNSIGDSLSNLTSSNEEQNREDEAGDEEDPGGASSAKMTNLAG